MAKPSIRIWNARIYCWPRQSNCRFEERCCVSRMWKLPGGGPGSLSCRSVAELDEARELDVDLGDVLGPDRALLAVLPLQHQSGDQALAIFDRVGERIVLAVELDAADRAFPVGLLERGDELVGVGRAGALHRVGDVVDLVIGGVAGI